MPKPDPRLSAYRADLADIRLKGEVEARRYVEGIEARVMAERVTLKRSPRPDAPQDSELLYGENVLIFEKKDGWAWIQNETDGYVGYCPEKALAPRAPDAPTHRITVPRSFAFPEPDIKVPPVRSLFMSVDVTVTETDIDPKKRFVRLSDGSFALSGHMTALDVLSGSPLDQVEKFMNVPYLWGGKTAGGLDCSGIIQVALLATGCPCPRDTDMQEKALGRDIGFAGDFGILEAGDLVFWKGHVGMVDRTGNIVHANATDMAVTRGPAEKICAHIRNIESLEVTSVKRLSER